MSWLTNIVDYITGTELTYEESEANIARQQRLLAEQRDRRVASGELTTVEADRSYNAFIANVGGAESPATAYREGFVEGLGEGAANIRGAASSIAGGVDKGVLWTIGTALRAIPWTVYLGVGIVAFLWLGGGVWLLKKSKGILSR